VVYLLYFYFFQLILVHQLSVASILNVMLSMVLSHASAQVLEAVQVVVMRRKQCVALMEKFMTAFVT